MENNKDPELQLFKSREFLEKAKILEMEKELIELKHKYRMEEASLERKLHHEDHVERLREIRLKSANIRRAIDDKDRRIREDYERRRERFK